MLAMDVHLSVVRASFLQIWILLGTSSLEGGCFAEQPQPSGPASSALSLPQCSAVLPHFCSCFTPQMHGSALPQSSWKTVLFVPHYKSSSFGSSATEGNAVCYADCLPKDIATNSQVLSPLLGISLGSRTLWSPYPTTLAAKPSLSFTCLY